ncbi:hypothetical protein [Allocoleopsis sp.]
MTNEVEVLGSAIAYIKARWYKARSLSQHYPHFTATAPATP